MNMRILTFTSLFPNSQAPNHGIFLLQRTLHLARREGNQVQVMAPLPYAPKLLRNTVRGRVSRIPRIETIAGLKVHHPRYPLLPGISMPLHGALMAAGCMDAMRALHCEHHFDCIDAHYVFPDGLAAVLIGRSLGIPVTITARGSDIHTFPNFVTIRPQIRWTLRKAQAVVGVSNSLAQAMMDLQPALANVDVIGNGVECARFYPEHRAIARRRMGFAPDDKVVLCVAALRNMKGQDLLIRALARLRKEVANLRAVFVGEGEALGSLRQLARRLDCQDLCQFVGAVPNEELRHFYSAADVSCLPSRKEGWPNVVLESLACGTPVVGTAIGAVPELLGDPELGIVVQPHPESICDGLLRALERSWDRDSIVEHARSYSWEDVADRVEDLLRRSIRQELPELDPALLA